MPRYFFNVEDGSAPDPEGYELTDLASAKCEAVKLAGNLICDAAGSFWDTQEFVMKVTNEDGLTLFLLELLCQEAPAIRG